MILPSYRASKAGRLTGVCIRGAAGQNIARNMVAHYFELCYNRREDGQPITLITGVPTVRMITIGGNPGDLRLPGVAPTALFARVAPEGDQFRVLPESTETEVFVNDRRVPAEGVLLEVHDQITIGEYRLSFCEGEQPEESKLFETHLRWKVPVFAADADDAVFDAASRPYIEEFELSVRHLAQSENWLGLRDAAEKELARLIRSPDADSLEGYAQYLWWTRLRMAREGADPRSPEIAQEAFDLYPESPVLMVSCGLTFLAQHSYATAKTAFERGIRGTRSAMRPTTNDARLGLILTDHLEGRADAGVKLRKLPRTGWAVPMISLDAPGDEVILWRMALHGRVFGSPEHVRFAYAGPVESESNEFVELHRWEIFDTHRGLAWRRILKHPTLTYTDPSLMLEVASIRGALAEHPQFTRLFIDRNETRPEAQPIRIEAGVLDLLPAGETIEARLWFQGERLQFKVGSAAQPGDMVLQHSRLRLAVDDETATMFGGGVLRKASPTALSIEDESGEKFLISLDVVRQAAPAPAEKKRWFDWRIVVGAAAIVGLGLIVLRVLATR